MKIGLVAPVGAAPRQHDPFAVAPTGAFVQDRCFSHGSRRGLTAAVPTGTVEKHNFKTYASGYQKNKNARPFPDFAKTFSFTADRP